MQYYLKELDPYPVYSATLLILTGPFIWKEDKCGRLIWLPWLRQARRQAFLTPARGIQYSRIHAKLAEQINSHARICNVLEHRSYTRFWASGSEIFALSLSPQSTTDCGPNSDSKSREHQRTSSERGHLDILRLPHCRSLSRLIHYLYSPHQLPFQPCLHSFLHVHVQFTKIHLPATQDPSSLLPSTCHFYLLPIPSPVPSPIPGAPNAVDNPRPHNSVSRNYSKTTCHNDTTCANSHSCAPPCCDSADTASTSSYCPAPVTPGPRRPAYK